VVPAARFGAVIGASESSAAIVAAHPDGACSSRVAFVAEQGAGVGTPTGIAPAALLWRREHFGK
jgi:hypothetical protein